MTTTTKYVDEVSLRRLRTLHPVVRDDAITLFNRVNNTFLAGRAKLRVTSALRTVAEQNQLYAQGRTKSGKIVTNAKGGQSMHNYGLAFDFCLVIDGKTASWEMLSDWDYDNQADWEEAVVAFTTAGWEWAGNWKTFREYCHFQKSYGLSVSELQKKPKDKDGYVILF